MLGSIPHLRMQDRLMTKKPIYYSTSARVATSDFTGRIAVLGTVIGGASLKGGAVGLNMPCVRQNPAYLVA